MSSVEQAADDLHRLINAIGGPDGEVEAAIAIVAFFREQANRFERLQTAVASIPGIAGR